MTKLENMLKKKGYDLYHVTFCNERHKWDIYYTVIM